MTLQEERDAVHDRRVFVRRAEDRRLVRTRERSRREGDTRPWIQGQALTFKPAHGEPFRWLPKHGEPLCVGEWLSQTTWEHRLMLYIALVVTLTLAVVIWGANWIPLIGG